MPDIALIAPQPFLHLSHLLLRYHSPVVEYARVFLQVFKRRRFPRALALRRHIGEYVLPARHVIKRPRLRVRRFLVVRGAARKSVRRVLNVEYYRLIADFFYLRRFLIPSASYRSRYSGVSLKSPD